ncbi:MAG: hypothetical protein KatS3mg115_0026 [Candidatus Poribacteria bacterium]|nr:MAG: hypothetical protein KatS3mg115_0026 [Candidatus Poribacteria bacterium]
MRNTGAIAGAIFLFTLALGTMAQAPHREPLVGSELPATVSGLALGDATVGRARGVEALTSNPAGLGAMRFSELSGTGLYRSGQSTLHFRGAEFPQRQGLLRLGGIGIAHQTEWGRGLGVGFSIRQRYDLNDRLLMEGIELSGDFQEMQIREEESHSGEVYVTTLGIGAELFPGVRAGAAVELLDGTVTQSKRFEATPPDHPLPTVVFDDDLTRAIAGSRLRLGLELGVTPFWNLGAALALPADWEIREEWVFRTRLRDENGEDNPPVDAGVLDYTFHVPAELGAGTALQLGELRLYGAIRYTDWTQAEYRPVPARDISPRLFERSYSAVLDGGLGIEWTPNRAMILRVGWEQRGNPFRWIDDTVLQTSWSLGYSQRVGRALWLDIAYRYTSTPELLVEADLIERHRAHRLAFGARVVF